MTNTRLREDEPSQDPPDRQGKVRDIWSGLLWATLWCCLEHSGEEVWKASCDHRCTVGESSQG